MTTTLTRKRERSFVNKKFQISFILLVFAPILLNAIIFFVAKEIMYDQKLALGEQLGLPSDHGYYELLKIQQATETKTIVFSSIASAFIFLAWALYISHRIAGPFYRLEQDLRNTKPGEGMRHVHFRPSDFFQEIPIALNEFLDKNNLTDTRKKDHIG